MCVYICMYVPFWLKFHRLNPFQFQSRCQFKKLSDGEKQSTILFDMQQNHEISVWTKQRNQNGIMIVYNSQEQAHAKIKNADHKMTCLVAEIKDRLNEPH
jgi:hypothetical protein